MTIIDRNAPVLVTGGAGYMASWVVKMLLEEGINVHATVRDPEDDGKTGHLRGFVKPGSGCLDLFKADLLDPASFDEAASGCELVVHTASPFFLTGVRNAQEELIRPAVEGTTNVLSAATRAGSVKRVVLTSSVVAVYGDNVDIRSTPSGIFTENDWNTTSTAEYQPYPYSKTVAEKTAWRMAKEQKAWDLVVVNPGFILGPALSRRKDSMSIATMVQLGDGTFARGVPELWNGIVDVRDVAAAHIKAGFAPDARGRYILVSGEATLLDIARILRARFGEDYPFPRRQAPKALFWLTAPLYGYRRAFVRRNIGILIRFDNSRATRDLGVTFIPVDRTVTDHFQQILDDGMLQKE